MNTHAITVGELAFLTALVVSPFLIVAGLVQYFILRKLGLRTGALVGLMVGAAAVTVLLGWGLLYVVPAPPIRGYGVPLIFPVLIATAVVTVGLAVYARRHRSV